jgi:hypothetical protein
MKKYETDFFWSFKDGEAKYENGITELFYENKKIGKVTATDEEVVYNFKGIPQWQVSNYRSEILNSSEKKAKIYIDGRKIVEKDFSGNFILYEDTEDFGKFINSAKEVKNERQVIRIENFSGNFRAEFQDEKFRVIESVGKAKTKFENSNEMLKTENGYTAVIGKKVSVYVNPENLIDGVILFEHMVNLEYSPFEEKEVYKKSAEMLRKILKENLIGEEGASPNLEKELAKDRLRIDKIYAFQKMFGLAINLPYEKVLELSRENIKGPKVSLALSFETETFSGTVNLLQDKAKIKIEASKTSLDNVLKTYRELIPVTETGYSLIFGIPAGNPVIDFMDVDGIIKASKRKYAKTDFKKLQKLSEETGKKIEFRVISEYEEFEIDKDTLILIGCEDNVMPEKYKPLKDYFKKIEILTK